MPLRTPTASLNEVNSELIDGRVHDRWIEQFQAVVDLGEQGFAEFELDPETRASRTWNLKPPEYLASGAPVNHY